MTRWIYFLIAFVIGTSAGIYYGWVLSPVQVVDTTPDTLRIDYRADYTLMVAEIYLDERDPSAAARRLSQLGADSPALIVQQAIVYAEQSGYSERDMSALETLRNDMQTWNPSSGQENVP
jgi:hypothetical protein